MILYYSESIEKYLFGGYIFREELHARMHIWPVTRFVRTGEWECGFSIDGGRILMLGERLCGGRILREGLHALSLACIFGP